jgi:V/A-type H+-transporting ATPase subunit E
MDTTEKLNKFSHMVMKEAQEKKKEIITQAEQTRNETIESSEIEYLKMAYNKIQNAIRKIDKSINEEVSKAVVESKQALFNRRDEIIDGVFKNVRNRIEAFKKQDEYRTFLEGQLKAGLSQVGEGEIVALVDGEDISLMQEILKSTGLRARVEESDELLLGGCILINRTKNIMSDCSVISRLNQERASFLENYGLSIE